MIEVAVDSVSKFYEKGAIHALNNISFEVSKGELFGVIGPDGAGKTSLFRILATLLLADSGSAKIAGMDVVEHYKKIRGILGYMPGRFSLYQDLTVEENLSFFATIFNTTIQKNYELIRDIYVQLEPFKKRRAGKLSGGMKQKLALCCALIHRPRVLLLDEPTTGVDPVSRKEFWLMLQRLQQQEISIVVSTPYMDEATLCQRIGLIQKGTMLTIDSPNNVIHAFPKPLYSIFSNSIYQTQQLLHHHSNVESVFAFGDTLHCTFFDNSETSLYAIQQTLQAEFPESTITAIVPSIEDCFIRLMTHKS